MAAIFTDQNFAEEVLKSPIPVVVDFWATWCGPCQMMAPIIEALAGEYEGKIKIGKLDIEENPEMSEKYGILSIPTMKIYKNGEVVEEMVGAMSADKLRERLNAHA